MHATVERKALLKLIQGFKVIVSRKPTLPIMACVHLTATTSGLDVRGADIESGTHARVRMDCTTIQGGECAVDRVAFANAVKACAGDFVTVRRDGLSLCVGDMTLPTQDVDAFPSMPSVTTAGNAFWAFEKALIQRIDSAVRPVCCKDTTRYTLCGLFFDGGNAYATDGHRLHMVPTGLEARDGIGLGPVLLPALAWDAMVALTGAGFRLQWSDRAIAGEDVDRPGVPSGTIVAHGCDDRVRIVTRVIDGRYPDVMQVIPQWDGTESSASFNVKALRTALAPHAKLDGTTRLHMNGTLALSTQNPDKGKADNVVECARKGADVTWGANTRYILDAAEALDQGQVELRTWKEDVKTDDDGRVTNNGMITPFEISDGTVRCVVMPMRI